MTTANRCTTAKGIEQTKSKPPAPERNQGFTNQITKLHSFKQTQNQLPPGQVAGSQTCNAQAIWDDPDDLTKSKKTSFIEMRALLLNDFCSKAASEARFKLNTKERSVPSTAPFCSSKNKGDRPPWKVSDRLLPN